VRALATLFFGVALLSPAAMQAADAPVPLLAKGKPVDWWFVYKFNSKAPFNMCGEGAGVRTCPFGGKIRAANGTNYSQQYVFASSDKAAAGGKSPAELMKGKGCVGTTMTDPLGATFDEIYNATSAPFFVVWNDQFYGDPTVKACGSSGNCDSPWGHSKGMLAWNEAGEGLVLQVTTPSWPGAGNKKHPRKAGNTLGCVSTQNNISNAQHFFALKLNKAGVMAVLTALENSSVGTDPGNAQIANIGGPADIQAQAEKLGKKPTTVMTPANSKIFTAQLTPDVKLISKPSTLNVPPWQMVSVLLNSTSERTATWSASPQIYSTLKTTPTGCLNLTTAGEIKGKKPGAVAIAKTGTWDGNSIGLIGGQNHAKIGVIATADKNYAVFGDLNQQGTINPPHCERSQNGRGGMFFVVDNKELFDSVTGLIAGESEPVKAK